MKRFRSFVIRLFTDTPMSWRRVILFALAAGVYTGLINQVPFLENTSFRDIAVSFEWWILFGTVIAVNCDKPLEAGLKVFAFFMISQPAVFLVELPSIGLAGAWYYFRSWFFFLLLTFPGGIAAYFAKQNGIIGALAVALLTAALGLHFVMFLAGVLSAFPRHLLSCLFCLVVIVAMPEILIEKKAYRFLAAIVALALCLLFVGLLLYTPAAGPEQLAAWQWKGFTCMEKAVYKHGFF